MAKATAAIDWNALKAESERVAEDREFSIIINGAPGDERVKAQADHLQVAELFALLHAIAEQRLNGALDALPAAGEPFTRPR